MGRVGVSEGKEVSWAAGWFVELGWAAELGWWVWVYLEFGFGPFLFLLLFYF